MAYADTGRLTRLLGNPSTSIVSSADISNAAAFGDSWINTITGVTTWTSSDPSWQMITSASEIYGAAYILRFFWGQHEKADIFEKAAVTIIEKVLKESSTVYQTTSTNYRTWPANQNAGPYVSNNQLWTNSDGTNTDPGAV